MSEPVPIGEMDHGAEPPDGDPAVDGADESAPAYEQPVTVFPAVSPDEPAYGGDETAPAYEQPVTVFPAVSPDEPVAGEPVQYVTTDYEQPGYESYQPEPMFRMLFVDVVLVLPSTHPVVVLQEADSPYREIRIPIGGAEGVAIGYAARQMRTPRPLTHELMSKLLESFSLNLDVVRVTAVEGRTFRAEIVVSGPTGSRTIDCRPSDAIALALRQPLPVPIVASPAVLDAVGGEAAGQN